MSSHRLRDHIERVVGPVQASESRKDRMREELAGHLTASYEEEHVRFGSDLEAVERAIQRLGEVGELTRSLQDSVPWIERILCTPLQPLGFLDDRGGVFRRRDNETILHHAIRITAWMTAVIAVADLAVCLLSIAVRTRPIDWSVALPWAASTLVVVSTGTFLSILLCEGMVRAIRGNSSRRIALYAALSSLMVTGLIMVFVLLVSVGAPHGQVFRQSDGLRLLPVFLLVPPIAVWIGAQGSISIRRRREGWELPEITA